MTIDRLRKVLGAVGPEPDARELSEMLWLACHLPPPPGDLPPARPRPDVAVPPPPQPATLAPPFPTAPPDLPADPTPLPPPPPPSVPLTLPSSPDAPGGGDAAETDEATDVLVPTAPMLTDPRGVQRSLRPLKRSVPSAHRFELDEDATAARIADTGVWTPVLVPSPERWLSLTLVVDTGPTMRLWRPLAGELSETLLRLGVFRDVHVRYLDTTGRITAATGAPSQDPSTLLDTSGRRAVLVLSDCCGPHWWDGRAARAVRRWAGAGPTAIVQPLAERLWRRTAAPASPGLAHLPRPGAPNTDLRFAPHDGTAAPGVPVPVLEAEPRWFGAWARLVSGSGSQPAAVATLSPRPPARPAPARERELPVAERVRRFLATASPAAAELAAHVAVSVPSLPVMRLIQHRVLGRSGPGQLAEVLLSGLLRPVEGARYEFVPGAREALLDTLPRPEAQHTRRVLEAVSAEIERRAGRLGERFRALMPAEGGPFTLTADADHFALVTPETGSALAPSRPSPPPPEPPPGPDLLEIQDADVDDLIGPDWDRPLAAVPIGADDWGTVSLDVRPTDYGAHGLITGPPDRRDALVRTLVFSLALRHSPQVVNFAFVGTSASGFFAEPSALPHVAMDVHPVSAESPQFDRLADVLETERRRREAAHRGTGPPQPDDLLIDLDAEPVDPPPTLIVFIDDAGRLFEARPNLVGPFAALCGRLPAQGVQFVFCTPDDAPLPPELTASLAWQLGAADTGEPNTASLRVADKRMAFLHIPGEVVYPPFRPAHLSVGTAGPLVERMRRTGPYARRIPPSAETASPARPPAQSPAEVAPEEVSAPPSVEPEQDVLTLNGGGPGGSFEAAWELPRPVPRRQVIGFDPSGNAIKPFPFGVASDVPHALVVGETEARQHIVRDIIVSLAAAYSPRDLAFAFAGLREHPLGTPIDLPHVIYSRDELLERPWTLQQFRDFLSAELATRSAPAHGRPGLVVVVDVSPTLPSDQPDLTETLLELAESGAPRDLHLLIVSSTVEDTAIWNRLLPLLRWRVTASRLPSAVLQRIRGRADPPFSEERTAHLSSGDASSPFTPAPDAPSDTIDDFVEQAHKVHADTVLPRLLRTDARAEDPAVWTMLRSLYIAERRSVTWGPPNRHLLVVDADPRLVTRAAILYGRLLAGLGILSDGAVLQAVVDQTGRSVGEPYTTTEDLFRAGRGGVLLIHRSDTPYRVFPPLPGFPEHLRALMAEYSDDPIVVLPVTRDQEVVLRRTDPFFDDRFRSIWMLASLPRPDPGPQDVPDRRIPLGADAETGEPVLLDLAADRHLLVTGPPGRRKTNLLRRILTAIVGDGDGQESLVYILDERKRLRLSSEETGPNVRLASNRDEFGSLLEAAFRRTRARRQKGHGPDVYIFAASRRRLLRGDPLMSLLPMLGESDRHGLHLILSRDQFGSGESSDPVVRALGEAKAPALLTGYSQQEAEVWNIPPALFTSLTPGQAVLARDDRYTVIQLRESDDQ